VFGSEPNCCHIGSLGCKYSWTGNLGTVWGQSRNLSELDRLSEGFPVGPFVDLFNAVVCAIWYYNIPKIMDSTSSNHLLHILRFAISNILESTVFVLYFLLLCIKGVNSSVVSPNIRLMPFLPNMQEPKLLTCCWWSLLWWGTDDIMHCFARKGHHYYMHEFLPWHDT
jgi:hypothetical protein